MANPCPDPQPWTGRLDRGAPAVAVPEDVDLAFRPCWEADWDDALPLEVEPVAALLPVGCDAYVRPRTSRGVYTCDQYRWLVVESLGDGAEAVGEWWIGRCTDAHDRTVDDLGWAGVLGVGWQEWAWADWLARAGVAPGQPFLVRVEHQAWTSSQGEPDDDVAAEVVAYGPRPADFVERWAGGLWLLAGP